MWAKFGNLCKPKVKRGNFNNLYVRLRTHVDIKLYALFEGQRIKISYVSTLCMSTVQYTGLLYPGDIHMSSTCVFVHN